MHHSFAQTQSMINPPEAPSEHFYRKVPVSDYKNFQSLEDNYYAKDADHVYKDWTTTDGRNISIFEKANPKTFSVINYRLGKDKNHAYYYGSIIDELNVDSLVILCEHSQSKYSASSGLLKDNKNVFNYDKKLESIDAATFECIVEDSKTIYRDKDWIYHEDYFDSMNPEKRTKRE